MSSRTTNVGLTKPAPGEPVLVADLNTNFDTIDASLTGLGGAPASQSTRGIVSFADIDNKYLGSAAQWAIVTDPQFGAVGNMRTFTHGSITAASNTYNDSVSTFSITDVGKTISCLGAGPAGATLTTTIASFVDSHNVHLAANASTTVSTSGICLFGHDDTAAIQAAITSVGSNGTVILPRGSYLTTSTIALGAAKRLQGANQNFGSILQCVVDGMTGLTVSSSAVVEDLVLEGNNVGGWGIKTLPQANKIHLQRVRCEGWQAGFVHEATQNSVSVDCFSQNNQINYALYNGVANCKFVNCNGANLDALPTVAGTRSIVVANSVDGRLTGTVYAGGNRNISFFGGIFERGAAIDYQIQLSNLTNYISFTETEFDNGTIANVAVDSTVGNIPIIFNRCDFHATSPATAVAAASGRIKLNDCTYTGNGGRAEALMVSLSGSATWERPLSSATEPSNIFDMNTSFFQTGVGAWVVKSTGTITYNATTKRINIASTSTGTGAQAFFGAGYASFIAAGRLARLRFFIRNLTGATSVALAFTNNSGLKSTLGTFPEGMHDVLVDLDGDESGVFLGAGSGTSTTFDVCYFTAAIF